MRRAALAAILLAALAACSNGKSGSGASPEPSGATSSPMAAATPDCHGQTPVWILGRGKSYVLPGNDRYGKTENGRYMCLSDAQSQGYHEGRGRGHRHHHRHRGALSQ